MNAFANAFIHLAPHFSGVEYVLTQYMLQDAECLEWGVHLIATWWCHCEEMELIIIKSCDGLVLNRQTGTHQVIIWTSHWQFDPYE